MRKPVTDLEIVYEQAEVSAVESEQRLSEMFDILFEETLQYLKEMKEKKAVQKNNFKFDNQIQEGGERYGRFKTIIR